MEQEKYEKRFDGRTFDELRKIEAKVGVIKNAKGSAYFKIGKTACYAAVYGPNEVFPKFLSDSTKALLKVNYSLLPFSGQGDRVRPGPSRRSKEISYVMEKALTPAINLEEYKNSQIEIYVDMTETDAGSRCAAINAATLALCDAGIEMKDLVCAVAVGTAKGELLVDLDYNEEALHGSDIPVAYIPNLDQVSLLQNDGIIDKEDLFKLLEKAKTANLEIKEILRNALKEKYQK